MVRPRAGVPAHAVIRPRAVVRARTPTGAAPPPSGLPALGHPQPGRTPGVPTGAGPPDLRTPGPQGARASGPRRSSCPTGLGDPGDRVPAAAPGAGERTPTARFRLRASTVDSLRTFIAEALSAGPRVVGRRPRAHPSRAARRRPTGRRSPAASPPRRGPPASVAARRSPAAGPPTSVASATQSWSAQGRASARRCGRAEWPRRTGVRAYGLTGSRAQQYPATQGRPARTLRAAVPEIGCPSDRAHPSTTHTGERVIRDSAAIHSPQRDLRNAGTVGAADSKSAPPSPRLPVAGGNP